MQCAKTHGFEMQKQNTIEMLLECTFIIFDIWQVCLKDSYKSVFFPLRRRSKGALQSGHRLIHQGEIVFGRRTTVIPPLLQLERLHVTTSCPSSTLPLSSLPKSLPFSSAP